MNSRSRNVPIEPVAQPGRLREDSNSGRKLDWRILTRRADQRVTNKLILGKNGVRVQDIHREKDGHQTFIINTAYIDCRH